jgi:hypothetical protein
MRVNDVIVTLAIEKRAFGQSALLCATTIAELQQRTLPFLRNIAFLRSVARIRRVSPLRLKYAVNSAAVPFGYPAGKINHESAPPQHIPAPRTTTFRTRVTMFSRMLKMAASPVAF